MNAYDDRPWRALYREPEPAASGVAPGTLLDMFQAAVDAAPHAPAVHYFDATASWAQLDAWSDAVAALLIARGFTQGDRLALCLQNGPAFLIGLVAAWKSGGIAALISPMSKPAEFDAAIRDYAPTALLALDYLYEDVAREVLDAGGAQTPIVITVSPLDFQTRDDHRLFAGLDRRRPADTLDLAALVSGPRRRAPAPARPRPGDIAVLAPTSGTTGEPKGAMLTHRNLVVNAHTYRGWIGLPDGEPVLAMAPIFHVTGLVGSVFAAMSMRAPVVLTHRFHPAVVLDAISEWRPTFTVAAITAFIALADEPGVSADSLGSLRWLYSGGAPIIPAVADRLEDALGRHIHNVYGQTETASPTHMVPRGVRAPVDRETGVMSVGVPVFGTQVWVVDDAGAPVPPGRLGMWSPRGRRWGRAIGVGPTRRPRPCPTADSTPETWASWTPTAGST